MNGSRFAVPELREGAEGALVLGVRPEHIRFSDTSDYRGMVLATEYLGTDQIVTLETHNGEAKARVSSAMPVSVGEQVGLELDARTLTVFSGETGRALRSAANEGVLGHG